MDNNPKVMTIEQQALALVNEVWAANGLEPTVARDTLSLKVAMEALERHEADKAAWQAERQEVSNSVVSYFGPGISSDEVARDYFSRFIIAPPADPLGEVFAELGWSTESPRGYRPDRLRAALAKHGLQITGVET